MRLTINPKEFILFRDLIEQISGIRVGENKTYLLENRLTSLVHENGCRSFSEFYDKVQDRNALLLREQMIDFITTNETLWFRDMSPFLILQEKLLQKFFLEISEGKRHSIRIWSVACSTGQEPYSMAMIIMDAIRKNPFLHPKMFQILATDISSSSLLTAETGKYDHIAISRGLPESYRNRYFKNDSGRLWSIAPEVKQAVTFKRFNLRENFARFGRFDIIFCRNVAIYFSIPFKHQLFTQLANTLRPDGFLLLGASESINTYSTEFKMLEHNRYIYYQVHD